MQNTNSAEKTKNYIVEALFELMKDKPFDEISVTDIATKAGIGRATYYRHFESKDDIIRHFFNREMHDFNAKMLSEQTKKEDVYEVVFRAFSKLKEKKDAISVIIKVHRESIWLDFLNESIVKNINENWSAAFDSLLNYVAYYMAGCLFNVSLEWVRGGCAESVKTITDLFVSLVFLNDKGIFK